MQDKENNVVEMVPQVSEPESGKVAELTQDIEEADKQLEELQELESRLSEDLIVQENEWLKARMEEQRKDEHRLREELFEKQKLLEDRRREQAEEFAQSRQMRLYNQMHEEEQRDMVYALHGISVDKEEGMKEYKNALYQGAQIILFFADIAICIATGLLHGWNSAYFVACIALLAAQSTLLPREHRGKLNRSLYSYLSMILSFLPTPVMAMILVTDQIPYISSDLMILGVACGSVVLSFVGALDYFVRNPYRESWFAAKAARSELKELKRTAAKNVKKNQKLRNKLITKLTKKKEKQESRLAELKEREERKYIKAKEREENKARRLEEKQQKMLERKARYNEIATLANENRAKKKEILDSKIVDFKERVNSIFNKKAN